MNELKSGKWLFVKINKSELLARLMENKVSVTDETGLLSLPNS